MREGGGGQDYSGATRATQRGEQAEPWKEKQRGGFSEDRGSLEGYFGEK